MKEPTLVINPFVAHSVTINVQCQAICRNTKEPTLEKNDLAALSVTTNAQDQAI